MIERIVIIDNVDPVSFYGVNNSNMQLIRNLFPKLRVTARGSVLRVLGDEDDTALFEQKIKELEAYCAKYNKLTEDVIIDVMRGDKPKDVKSDGVVIYGVNGKPITPRNHNQKLLVEAFNDNDLTFALGRRVRARRIWLSRLRSRLSKTGRRAKSYSAARRWRPAKSSDSSPAT